MPVQILMPALSPTMTEGKLARWLKAEGAAVKSGEPIAEIETDKATMEYEAAEDGVLGKILVPAGTEGVAVNSPIGVLLLDGEDASAIGAAAAAPVAAAAPAPTVPAAAVAAAAPVAAIAAQSAYTGPTKRQTVRESLRDAMAEEMRRDDKVFLLGE